MSVKLRKKNLADGKKGLYLDIYHNGQRHYDFLKLYLVKGTSSRIVAANRETLELSHFYLDAQSDAPLILHSQTPSK